MTGFGAAEGDVAGRRARVEIRTVNHRWFNLASRLPGELASVEADLREALRRRFERGHVSVSVRWVDGSDATAAIDLERAEAVVAALRELQHRFDLGGEVSVELVARQADVFAVRRSDESVVPWAALEPVVTEAAAECSAARGREGIALCVELETRLGLLEEATAQIAERAPERLVHERSRLGSSVAQLLEGRPLDEGRLTQEIALLADRLDITEELVRFRAHLAAARETLAREQPVGKQLGFLAQEMGREVNTIGAKANDAAIAHHVVAMKAELEKVREQLENLE